MTYKTIAQNIASKNKEVPVAIAKCESYNPQTLSETIALVAREAQMPNVGGKTVLLKPNILSDAKPQDCITTHPEFVRAVIKYLKNCGVKEIYVGDSPGLQNPSFEAKRCGIKDVCDDEGAIWADFTINPVQKEINGTGKKLLMANIIDKVDMVFSLAKFKTHQFMYTTGAVKNMFGTIPGLHKSSCHVKCPSRESFAKLIVGIYETVKPAFSFMDGIIGMEGAGPANGNPRTLSLVLGSCNGIALDTAQAIIMGYNPKEIPILKEASRRHILPANVVYPVLDAQQIVVKDFDMIPVREKTKFVKTLVLPFLTRGIQKKMQSKQPAPVFDKDKCIRCLKCVHICPAHALSLSAGDTQNRKDRYIIANYSKCIRCYCCHEMCPVNAIFIDGKG